VSIKLKYILVVIVTWLVVAVLIIIPRFISIQPAAAIPAIATNATNADIVNAIYSLHTAISNMKDTIKDTIYIAMGIEICVLVAVITMKK